MPFYWLFPLLLLMLAVGLAWWNVRAWRVAQASEEDAEELQFGRRQFRRRIQASGLLALLALALGIGQMIPHLRQPTLYVLFWFGVLLLVVWVILLAVGDIMVNRQRLARYLQQRRVAEAKLNAELEQIRNRLAQSKQQPPSS